MKKRLPSTDSFRLQGVDDRNRTGAITLEGLDVDELAGRPSVEANVILIAHPENARLGTRYRLVSGTTVEIGRAETVELSLPEVRSISRTHARLRYHGRTVTIEDAGSTNGTFVNDQRVQGTAVLRSGDRFQVGSVHFKFLHEQDVEHAYHEAIYQMVMRDGLTEAFNQRKFHEELAREFARAQRHDRPLCVVVFDIDSFKEVNDTHGHLCGDMVLKQVAAAVRELLRPEQVFARLGGDEFAILLTGTESADRALLRLRDRVAAANAASPEPWSLAYTPGVARFAPTRHLSLSDLVSDADRAMYASKRK